MQKPNRWTSPNDAPEMREDIRFRREILIQAQQLVQQIERSEDQLELFHGMDLPAFEVWCRQTLAPENQKLEQLERAYAQAVQFHNSLVALAKLRRVSMPRAFEMIREEQASYASGSTAIRLKIEEDRLKREQFIRNDLQSVPSEEPDRESLPAPTQEPGAMELEQLKAVYRKLVRRLHPDLQGPHAEAGELRWQKRIWDLSQTARQSGQIAELETLYKVTLLRQLDFAELTIADAHDVYAWLHVEIERLNTALWQAQQNPAWGFTRLADLRPLATRLKQNLQNEIASLEAELEEIKGQHAYIEVLSYTPRPKRRTPRPRRDENQLSLFD